ncbi:hypothetical protein TrRE_jg1454, partial [Triparma retinervis]
MPIIIRLRSNLGVWRFNVPTGSPVNSSDLINVLKSQSENLTFTSELSLRQFPSTSTPPPLPPGDLLPHLPNGTMIYGYVTPDSLSPDAKKDGSEGMKKKFQYGRYGYLYGSYLSDNKVRVDFIYEPQQGVGSGGFEMISGSEEEEERVGALAEALGVKKVGWIFGHPPREEGFVFSSEEVIMAAEMQ